ncbi:MAG: N-acetylmuramoyl-L-alanine amidase-like domain-containing protein [Thermodesulfobacteriota bacterium]
MIASPEDRTIVGTLLRSAKKRGDRGRPLPDTLLAVGRHFLGAPYRAGTLEGEGPEMLVVNLRGFDCMTFVENAVVLAGLIRSGSAAFDDYARALERIRYRRGRCDGFASRLHYFTDWLHCNGRKGLVRDITGDIGGVPLRRRLHYLSDRRADLPALRNPAAFLRLRIVEGICSQRPFFFIPKALLERAQEGVTDGDIIAITTDATGLDVCHVGLAVCLRGRVHLLHASSAAGRVVLSDEPLDRYLRAGRSRTGIIVGRAL